MSAASWNVEPEPTNLITLWPRRDQPMLNELRTLFTKVLGEPVNVISQPPPPDRVVKWIAVLETKALPAPLVIWVEAMRPLPAETIKALSAEKIKWTFGIETVLDPSDPHSHFVKVLRLLGSAVPQSPGILNVNIGNWFLRKELEEKILRDDIEPTADTLWVMHCLRPNEQPQPDDKAWLFTQGLWRSGLPELEMLEVPVLQSGAAHDLLNNIAHLLVGEQFPSPGEPLEIGPGLEVTFQPWREMTEFIDKDSIGGLNHRKQLGYGTDRGVRAVVCGSAPIGTYKKLWTWPAEVVAVIQRGESAVYHTTRWTQRQEKLARATWNQLRDAFAQLPQATSQVVDDGESLNEPVFLVKAGFIPHDAPLHDDSADREHLWFRVLKFDNDRAEALLMNAPVSITALTKGDVRWLTRDVISDWQVITKLGAFGPGRADDMTRTISAILQEQPSP